LEHDLAELLGVGEDVLAEALLGGLLKVFLVLVRGEGLESELLGLLKVESTLLSDGCHIVSFILFV
jgi:hypothetical protein